MLLKFGTNVSIPIDMRFWGYNLEVGNNVFLSPGGTMMCTKAPVIMGDNIMFGPNVSMITGDYRIDIKGNI